MVELTRTEALHLLKSIDYGRVVFPLHALPAIRPVNHLVVDDTIIIRTHPSSRVVNVASDASAAVLVYEADVLDATTRQGWSVIVTGFAHTVTDPDLLARYEQLLHPWVESDPDMTAVIAIRTDLVTGFILSNPQ